MCIEALRLRDLVQSSASMSDAAVLAHQVRHRDKVSREVIIEERRYDKAGQKHTAPASVSTRGEPFDTTSMDNFDSAEELPAALPPPSSLPGSFGSSYSDEEANSDNPYAWAQRLREIPDKVLRLSATLCDQQVEHCRHCWNSCWQHCPWAMLALTCIRRPVVLSYHSCALRSHKIYDKPLALSLSE